MDCRGQEAWSILYRVAGEFVSTERIMDLELKRTDITQKCSPSQSASAGKPLERYRVMGTYVSFLVALVTDSTLYCSYGLKTVRAGKAIPLII